MATEERRKEERRNKEKERKGKKEKEKKRKKREKSNYGRLRKCKANEAQINAKEHNTAGADQS